MKTIGIIVLASIAFYGTRGLWHQIVTKRNGAVAIVLGAILIVMALTNPDESKFRSEFGDRYLGRINIGVLSFGAVRPTHEDEARFRATHPLKAPDDPNWKDSVQLPDFHCGLFGQIL